MQKSQLRNIIRESIKELMTEQSNSNVTVGVGDVVAVAAASPGGLTNPQDLPSPGVQPGPFNALFGGGFSSIGMSANTNTTSMSHNCGYSEVHTIDSQAFATEFNNIMSGQVGVYIQIASGNSYQALQSVYNQMDADFDGPQGGCTYVGPGSQPPVQGCTDSTATNYNSQAIIDDGSCTYTPPPSPMGTGCDINAPFPSSFNLQSWLNNWANSAPFQNLNNNPNQPCNFICGKRNQWESQLAAGGMGPAQTNMIACKKTYLPCLYT